MKFKKTDLICKNNESYEITYRVTFVVSQQTMNRNFIKLNNRIIQLKSELRKRNRCDIENKNTNALRTFSRMLWVKYQNVT